MNCWHVLQQPDALRGADDAVHRAADQAGVRPAAARGMQRRLNARHVGGEGGDGDAARAARDQLRERLAHVGLGAGRAVDEDVGGVADHGEHALVAHGAQRGFVGGFADQRIGIDLPVAGVQIMPERRADREAVRLGDRVGERDEVDLEGAERQLALQRDLDEFDLRPAGPRSRSFSRTRAAVNGVA